MSDSVAFQRELCVAGFEIAGPSGQDSMRVIRSPMVLQTQDFETGLAVYGLRFSK